MSDQTDPVSKLREIGKRAHNPPATDVNQLREAMNRASATIDEYAPPAVRMDKLERDITTPVPRLQQLAMDLSGLNFGEMIEFAGGCGGDAQKIWDWSVAYLAKDMKEEPK